MNTRGQCVEIVHAQTFFFFLVVYRAMCITIQARGTLYMRLFTRILMRKTR